MSVNLKTKRGRNSFYKKLLKVVCEDPEVNKGMCHCIGPLYRQLAGRPYYMGEDVLKGNLPELNAQKPSRLISVGWESYWFPLTTKGWEKRIACIEKAIELTN